MTKYRKLSHKFSIGDTVTLPGTRIRSQHYINQFAYNKTGTITKRGWSTPVSIKSHKVFEADGISFSWAKEIVHTPMYLVNKRWYREGAKNYGVIKLDK